LRTHRQHHDFRRLDRDFSPQSYIKSAYEFDEHIDLHVDGALEYLYLLKRFVDGGTFGCIMKGNQQVVHIKMIVCVAATHFIWNSKRDYFVNEI
jgi:hypothetical protein